MAKRTGPTNVVLQQLIAELKKKSIEQNANIWKRLATDLEKSSRSRRVVNLSRISMYTKENDIIVIPGKVLGAGEIGHKLTISAFQFSESAKEKLIKNGSKIVSLCELSNQNPQGKGIRIIG